MLQYKALWLLDRLHGADEVTPEFRQELIEEIERLHALAYPLPNEYSGWCAVARRLDGAIVKNSKVCLTHLEASTILKGWTDRQEDLSYEVTQVYVTSA